MSFLPYALLSLLLIFFLQSFGRRPNALVLYRRTHVNGIPTIFEFRYLVLRRPLLSPFAKCFDLWHTVRASDAERIPLVHGSVIHLLEMNSKHVTALLGSTRRPLIVSKTLTDSCGSLHIAGQLHLVKVLLCLRQAHVRAFSLIMLRFFTLLICKVILVFLACSIIKSLLLMSLLGEWSRIFLLQEIV